MKLDSSVPYKLNLTNHDYNVYLRNNSSNNYMSPINHYINA